MISFTTNPSGEELDEGMFDLTGNEWWGGVVRFLSSMATGCNFIISRISRRVRASHWVKTHGTMRLTAWWARRCGTTGMATAEIEAMRRKILWMSLFRDSREVVHGHFSRSSSNSFNPNDSPRLSWLPLPLGPIRRRGASGVLETLVMEEVVASPESPFTILAAVRFFPFVNEHVGLELVGIGEPVFAEVARKGLFPSVNPEVSSQIGYLNELTDAVGTLVRFLSSVEPHVSLQVVVPCEPFLADVAPERLLPSMSPLVILENVYSK